MVREANDRQALKRKTLGSVIWTLARNGSDQAFAFLSFAVLAHLLRPADFGLFTLAAASVELVTIVAMGGFTETVFRNRQEISDAFADTLFWASLGFSILVAILYALASVPIAHLLGQPGLTPVLLALAGSIPLSSFAQVHTARKLRDFGHRTIAVRSIVGGLIGLIASTAVALAGGGVWSFVVGRYVYLAGDTVLALRAFAWRPRLRFSYGQLRDVAGFCANVVASQFIAYLIFRAPYLLAGRFLGPVAVAHFRMANRALEFGSQAAMTPFVVVALPTLARLQDDPPALARAYQRLLGLTALLTCPLILGFGAVAQDAMLILFGPQWGEAVRASQVMSLAVGALVVGAFAPAALSAVGAGRAMANYSVVQLAGTLAAVALGLPYGLWGIAAAQTVQAFVLAPVLIWILKRNTPLGFSHILAPAIPPYLAALGMAAVLFLLRRWFEGRLPALPARLAVEVLAGAMLYASFLLCFGARYIRWQWEGARSMLIRSGAPLVD